MNRKEASPTASAFVACLAVGVTAGALLRTCAVGQGQFQLLPDAAVPVAAFAALVWPPPVSAALAACFGLDLNWASCAPGGLLPASMVLASLSVSSLRWRWFGRGAKDLALASGLLYLTARCAQLLLLTLAGRPVGIVSWAEASLLPGMVLHGVLGGLLRAPLEALWRRLAQAPPRSLGRANNG